MTSEESKIVVQPLNKAKIRHLIKVAIILFIVTLCEFIIAYAMAETPLRTTIFVVMTIIKAFYIVSEFMHLGHETKGLRWSVIFPLILVIWLLVALLTEGHYIFDVRF